MAPHREPCRGGTTTPPSADMGDLLEDELVVGEQYWMQDEKGDEVWTLAEVLEQCDGHVSIKLLDSGEKKEIDQVRWKHCKVSQLQQQLDAIRVHAVRLCRGRQPISLLSRYPPVRTPSPGIRHTTLPRCFVFLLFQPRLPPVFSFFLLSEGRKVFFSCTLCMCVLRRLPSSWDPRRLPLLVCPSKAGVPPYHMP